MAKYYIDGNVRDSIWDMYYKGYPIWKIAKELDITEAFVVEVLEKG